MAAREAKAACNLSAVLYKQDDLRLVRFAIFAHRNFEYSIYCFFSIRIRNNVKF
jgi:hypothetical protein